MLTKLNKKAQNEIITQIILVLIGVVVVGIIVAGLLPIIQKSKEEMRYKEALKIRDQVYDTIQELYFLPIGSTKELSFSLDSLNLDINASNNTIEISINIEKSNFFKDGLRQEEENGKYTFRKAQKLVTGFSLDIDLIRSHSFFNQPQVYLYLKKIDKDKIEINKEKIIDSEWFTTSSYLYEENPSTWLFRKKIIIDHTKVDGNLTNFPALIYLNDFDLNQYAKADGTDIMFTLGDGKTKLKREIESYSPRESYDYRKKITIDHTKVDGDLTDFPMLISLEDEDLYNHSKEDGSDIYFTLEDGDTRLPREIESFEDVNLLRKKITIDHTKVDGDLTNFPMLISLEDEDLFQHSKEDGSDIYFTLEDGKTRLAREIESFENIGISNGYRKKITIDHTKVNGDLTDFPMLISLEDEDLFNHSKEDGSDIYFTLEDGNTRIPREIEFFEEYEINLEDFRKKITIDHTKVEGDLENFPLLINLIDSDIATHSQEDGSDIYFTLEDGTKLKREINEDYIEQPSLTYYRKKITINHTKVEEDLYNFPVLLSLENDNLFNYIKEDGSDIFFTTNEGKTRLPREIELLEKSNQKLIVWVKVPYLSSTTNTEFYINFGNPEETNHNNSNVWDNDYAGVWHNNNFTSSTIRDSTFNNYLGDKTSINQPLETNGMIGKAQLFNGTSDYINVNEQLEVGDAFTVQAWIKANQLTGSVNGMNDYGRTIFASSFVVSANFPMWLTVFGSELKYLAYEDNVSKFKLTSNANLNTNDWFHIVATATKGGVSKVYVNGIEKLSFTNSAKKNWDQILTIGDLRPDRGLSFDGLIDEVRVSNVIRSSAWVKTEYENQKNNDSFFTLGSLETKNTVFVKSIIAWIKIPYLSSTSDTTIYMHYGGTNTDNYNDPEVWSNGYTGVWHSNDLTPSTIKDSTNYNNIGTKVSANNPIEINGKIGKAQNYNGIDSYITIPSTTIQTTSFWTKLDNVNSTQYILGGNNKGFGYNGTDFLAYNGSSGNVHLSWNKSNNWKFITIVKDNNNDYNIYVNGNYIGQTIAGTNGANIDIINFGKKTDGYFFNGPIDEVHFSNINRSLEWIKTEYNNQNDPSSFYTVGEKEETIGSKKLIAWVKLPFLSSTQDTSIYLNFGNPEEMNNNDTDVWENNYVGVWHTKDFTASTLLDSTINNNLGIKKSLNNPIETIGKIHKAQNFNTVNTHININTQLPISSSYTVEGWIKPRDLVGFNVDHKTYGFTVFASSYNKSNDFPFWVTVFGSELKYLAYEDNVSKIKLTSNANLNTNEWFHIVATAIKGGTSKLYVNGVEKLSFTNSGTTNWSSIFTIGDLRPEREIYFDGLIEDVRVSNVVRSPFWIETEYNNQNEPETFYSVSDLENTSFKKELIAWVKVPELSSTIDTDIYMYFGDPEENNENSTEVWDDYFTGVWHSNDLTPSTIKDSTSNNNIGTKVSTNNPIESKGKIGKAQLLNGTTDYIHTSSENFLPLFENPYTISLWINDDTSVNSLKSTYHRIISFANGSKNLQLGLGTDVTGTNRIFYIQENENTNVKQVTSGNASNGWHFVTATKNNNVWNIYLNGILSNNGTGMNSGSTAYTTNTGKLYIGQRGNGAYVNGKIDEIKISNIERSPSWIKTEYNNQNEPEAFYNVGNTENFSFEKELIAWVKVPELSSTVDTDIYMYFGNPEENNVNSTDVWDENFVTVLHFNNNISDSTKYNTTTSWNGLEKYTNKLPKGIGNSLDLRHNNYVIINNMPHNYFTNTDTFTMSVIYKQLVVPGSGNVIRIFAKNSNMGIDHHFEKNTLRGGVRDLIGQKITAKNEYPIGPTYYITYNYDPKNNIMKLFVDGDLQNTRITNDVGDLSSSLNFTIGASALGGGPVNIEGYIDEARISSTARSNKWIKTEYNNQTTPSEFYIIGEKEHTKFAKKIVAWVKLPELSSTTDTDIYMYFGDPEENNENSTDVWDSNYFGVWHSNDLTNTTLKDSTNNNYTGTKTTTSEPIKTEGKIGTARKYNGSSTYVVNNDIINLEKMTVSVWVNTDEVLSEIQNAVDKTNGWEIQERKDGRWRFYTNFTTDNWQYVVAPANSAKPNQWQYVVGTIDVLSQEHMIYVDGISTIRNTVLGDSLIQTGSIQIGGGRSNRFFKGDIDEIRISKIARSPSWIKTEYNNQNEPETFYNVGNTENFSFKKELIAWVKVPELSSTVDTDIYMYFGDPEENNVNSTEVWDDDYLGVWHNKDFNINTVIDSSISNNHGIKIAINEPYEIFGKIGYAQSFDGINDYINTKIKNINLEKTTISFWINFNNLNGPKGNSGVIFGSRYWVDNEFSITQHNNEKQLGFVTGKEHYAGFNNAFSDTKQWYHFTFSYDSTKDNWDDALKFYINGEVKNKQYSNGEINPLVATTDIQMSKQAMFNGLLDEVRFYKNTREPEWIKTEYNNQATPSEFYTLGEKETLTTQYNELFSWIKIPKLLKEEDTVIYMYFGNKDANEKNDKDTWDSDYILVNHLDEHLLDSTINNNNAENFGATKIFAKLGKGYYFDGISNYIVVGAENIDKYFDANKNWTISVWGNVSEFTTDSAILFNRYGDGEMFGFLVNNGYINFTTRDSTGSSVTGNSRSPKKNTWNYYTISRDYNNNEIIFGYNNTIEKKIDTRIGDFISDSTKDCSHCYLIGKKIWSYDFIAWNYFNGLIDEVRISKNSREPEWIKTEYTNQNDPQNFIFLGNLEEK